MRGALAAVVLSLCLRALAQEELEYLDNYRKALRLSGNDISAGALLCKSEGDSIGFFAELSPYGSDRQIAGENVPENMIFRVSYYRKNEKSGEITRYFEEDVAVLSVDSKERFRFTFIDSPAILYLELIDPNMKPIKVGEALSGVKIVKLDKRDDIYVENIVKLRENDAKAITCDLRVKTAHLQK